MFSASLTQIIDLLCNSLHYPGIKKNLNTKKSLWRNNIKIDLKRVIKSSEYLDLVSKFEFYADQTNNRWAFLARAWWILLLSDVDDVVEKKITSSEYHDLVTKFEIMETKPRTRWTEISKKIFKYRKESYELQIRMNISTIIQVTTAVIPNVNYV